MSRANSRKRIAVIAPRNRVWAWHHKCIFTLGQTYDVDVYTNALMPRYPFLVRFWIFLESYIFKGFNFAKFAAINAVPWRHVDGSNYAFVLNLSEVPMADLIVPILEICFGDQTDSLGLFATLLARKNPFLSIRLAGQKEPLVASYLAIPDRIVLLRGLQFSFARLTVLIERAIRHLTDGSRAAMLPKQTCDLAAYSTGHWFLFITRFFVDKVLGRLLRGLQYKEHWSIALFWANRWNIPHEVPLQEFRVLQDDGRRFYADPFLITDNEQKWLFVEEFDYRTNKGIISCANVTEGQMCKSPRSVLERAYHLSFPFLFRHDADIYMIPESGSNRTVELYWARSFPFEWELARVLLEGIELYDATVLQHKNRWWLFAAAATEGGSAQDELVIYYSEALEGPWQPHPLNPVKSDCRSARPAGHIISDGDRLLRPAQDCEHGYGTALVWFEIEELTLS